MPRKEKDLDYDQLEIVADKLLDLLKILNYIENTPIREVTVSVNSDDEEPFKFILESGMLQVTLTGLRQQLKQEIKVLKSNLVN